MPVLKHLPPSFLRIQNQTVHIASLPGLNPNGPEITLIHGIMASAITWMPLVCYLAPIAKRFILPDIPCHGLSSSPPLPFDCIDAYNLTAQAIRLKLSPNAQNIIIGNSLGGAFALKFCVDYPNLAKRCILISPAGAPFDTRAKDIIKTFCPLTQKQARNIVRRVYNHPPAIIEKLLPTILKHMAQSPAFQALMQSIIDIDASPDSPLAKLMFTPSYLQNITTKTCLIWGDNDNILTRSMRDFYNRYLPADAKRVFSKIYNHCPQFEYPKALAHDCIDFIQSP